MRSSPRISLWLVLAVLCGFHAVDAQEAASAKEQINALPGTASDTKDSRVIEQWRLSDALAEYGERAGDALALVEAAKLRKLLAADIALPESGSARTWESLLARANDLSGTDKAIAAAIRGVRLMRLRDIPTLPPDVHVLHRQLVKNGSSRAEVRFHAGELAIVYLRCDGTAAVALSIYDDLNNLICASANGGRDAECRWRPRRDGSFLIDVHNNNTVDVEYDLAINQEMQD